MGKIAIWGQFMYSVSLITQLNKELGEPEVEKYIEKVRPPRFSDGRVRATRLLREKNMMPRKEVPPCNVTAGIQLGLSRGIHDSVTYVSYNIQHRR